MNKIQQKIQKQIDGLRAKVDKLSAPRLTNTWKRMREHEQRQSQIVKLEQEIQLLEHLNRMTDTRELTKLETALTTSAFRETMHVYWRQCQAYLEKSPADRRDWMVVKYPEVDPTLDADGWYNLEVPKKQKRLKAVDITSTETLLEAIMQYGLIWQEAVKPIDEAAFELAKLINQAKLRQGGDIQFTPTEVCKRLVELADIKPGDYVLEPSAGIGNIADAARSITGNITCVEWAHDFCEILERKGYNTIQGDFLQLQQEDFARDSFNGTWDKIVANVPFSKNQDIQHVRHTYSLLRDGGTLVAITGKHWTFANEKACQDFRDWLNQLTHSTHDLPAHTFEMTGANSTILVIRK